MKATPYYPKVIIHRIGNPPVAVRRWGLRHSLCLALVLGLFLAGAARARLSLGSLDSDPEWVQASVD